MDPGSHVGFQISTKNTNLVEDHPVKISGKFALLSPTSPSNLKVVRALDNYFLVFVIFIIFFGQLKD
jgi:hypothetical protein